MVKDTAELTMVQAVNTALARAMTDDETVLVLGQDVGVNGGVFRATEGLFDRFGPDRVIDTPLSELGTTGASIGLAAQGFRPVTEIQFMGFIYAAMDQMVNHASRMRSRTRGRLTCPMVLRAPFGGGIHAPEHHSESTEAIFTNIPGLRVVIPSSPARAYGLLLAAIRDPDPVVFLEPKRLYRAFREDVTDDGQALPLDKCTILRAGTSLTVVTWGAMTLEAMEAAKNLAAEGIETEVVDVTTLRPLDAATILSSVEKTGRCLIVHEAPLTGGYGAEIAAQIVEHGLLTLLAPVKRVAGFDTVMPLPKLEAHYMPNQARILVAAREMMEDL
jgi:pyruvate dehydrogenase E1 component beta subunit